MYTNRLAKEKSPYLRQHAHNPVDWYPWCDEVFERAKREDKPIFLSIGYSSCHWCHVMNRESFEDEEIAQILNRFFISVKVDREERPDIDNIYMKSCYLFQNRGGWPLTVFLMPDKKPFYADTYIPKEDTSYRIGLKSILMRIIELWKNNRDKLSEVSNAVAKSLTNIRTSSTDEYILSEDTIHKTYESLRLSFDSSYGGFGRFPKFPLPLNFLFLHRYFYRYKNMEALQISLQTLKKMRNGGIYDHIGFGFHRYSIDQYWIVPHFEKMLYDNALLMIAYTEAYQITGEEFYSRVAEEIATYLLRDMYSPEGAFYSAEDADSEGKEGEFYLWAYDDIEKELNDEEFELAKIVYSLSKEGNFYEESTQKKIGKNIIYLSDSYENISKKLNIQEKNLHDKIESIRNKLFLKRQKRNRPMRDNKILTDWNSLAAIAFCKAGVVFENKYYIEISEKCIRFLISNMFDECRRLLHRYAYNEAAIYGYLEDYAYLIWALTELYFATFNSEYLRKAIDLAKHVLVHFWDEKGYGFYHTADYSEVIIGRVKEIYDGVLPSGNSIMAYNLIRLSRLTGNNEYEKIAYNTLRSFSQEIVKFPTSHVISVVDLDLLINGTLELSVVTSESDNEVGDFLRLIQKNFIPDMIILIKDSFTKGLSDKIGELEAVDRKTTYYLCRNFVCQPPITEKNKLIDLVLNL